MKKLIIIAVVALLIGLSSCQKDEVETTGDAVIYMEEHS